ncbi:hypothetical protein P148_SR1C00001G0138 [candidate division SR1 bacterium RAAC1_SR1_1]|nr:hypothetical protein P148_SR1C00001G0138 [candidate division SR1 bacterium RAAC1_SR1_1]
MENRENNRQNVPQKEIEIVGAHAKEIIERKIVDNREVNKWMDALCMDEEICKKILGEYVYLECKDSLNVSKEILDCTNDQAVLVLPEFQEFLKKYTIDKQKQKELLLREEEINKKKGQLKNMDLPESIKEEKSYLDSVKTTIREILSEKDEKMLGMSKTFLDVAKKYISNEEERKQKLNKIYDFILTYGESSFTKKKYKANESSTDFYKRIGVDYMMNEVRNIIQETEKKVQSKIKKRKEKQGEKIDIIEKRDAEIIDYTQEALQVFRDNIYNNLSIKSKFYLPEDQQEIGRIQTYFKNNMLESIDSLNTEMIVKDIGIQENVIEKLDDKVKMHVNDYAEITNRKHKFEKRFLDKDWNPREYLFDRLIEYIGKNILKYEIQEVINTSEKYRGTTFDIYKTDCLDDSFAYADYVVLYKFKNEKSERIALIDLFVSDKELSTEIDDKKELSTETNDEKTKIEAGSYAAKLEKAKEPKIPYSFYSRLFSKIPQKSYKMKSLTRYVEKQSPGVVYELLKEIPKKGNINIEKTLKEQMTKRNLCLIMKNKNKISSKNILQEIDKNAA